MRGETGPGSPDPPVPPVPPAELLLDVVRRVYEATVQPDAWHVILSVTAPLVGTEKAIYVRIDRTHPRDSVIAVVGVAQPSSPPSMNIGALTGERIRSTLLALPVGRVFQNSDLLPRHGLQQRSIYEEMGRPAGLEFMASVILENAPEFFSNVCYLRDDLDFGEVHKGVLTTLLPHLQLAAKLSQRIATGVAGRREALLSFDRARQPVVFLDRSGYAIYTNDCAKHLIASADGIDLKFGRFLLDNVATQGEFERAVRVAVSSLGRDTQPKNQVIRVARRRAGSPYALTVVPMLATSDRALLPDGTACMILIHDLERTEKLPLDRLAWLYRLTQAEVRICESLFREGSVDATALDLCISRHTVRSHLKSIFAKFGVVTQGQLIQRLANSLTLSDGLNRDESQAS